MQNVATLTAAPPTTGSGTAPATGSSGSPPGDFARTLAALDAAGADSAPGDGGTTVRQDLAGSGKDLPTDRAKGLLAAEHPALADPQADPALGWLPPAIADTTTPPNGTTSPVTPDGNSDQSNDATALITEQLTLDAKPITGCAPRNTSPKAASTATVADAADAVPALADATTADEQSADAPSPSPAKGKQASDDPTLTQAPLSLDQTGLTYPVIVPLPSLAPATGPVGGRSSTLTVTPEAGPALATAGQPTATPTAIGFNNATTVSGTTDQAGNATTAPAASSAASSALTIDAIAAALRPRAISVTTVAPTEGAKSAQMIAATTDNTTSAAISSPAPLAAAARIDPAVIGLVLPAGRAFAQAIAATAVPTRRTIRDQDGDAGSIASPLAAALAGTPPSLPIDPPAVIDTRHAKWIEGVIDHIDVLRDAANARDARIRLIPDALGKIDIALHRDGNAVNVRFTADQAATRQLLADAQPKLTELAASRGIRIGQSSIDGGGDRSASGGQQRPGDTPRQPIANRAPLQSTADDTDDPVPTRGWIA